MIIIKLIFKHFPKLAKPIINSPGSINSICCSINSNTSLPFLCCPVVLYQFHSLAALLALIVRGHHFSLEISCTTKQQQNNKLINNKL